MIEGLRGRVSAASEILRGIDLDGAQRRGPRRDGPQRLGQVDAVARDHGPARLRGHWVARSRSTAWTCSALPAWQRAQAGLFLAMQYPTEVPGVSLEAADVGGARGRWAATPVRSRELLRTEAARIGFDERFLTRPLNVDLSGGEKKRNETLQLGVLRPKIAILDELDSGLDIDALRAVRPPGRGGHQRDGLGVLAITHYSRLLSELKPDVVHMLPAGGSWPPAAPSWPTSWSTPATRVTGTTPTPSRQPAASNAAADPFADPLA